ncbi:LytS/YhcK type 5TM receptor domain-containing protein [Deinococcus peraridilitoris]|uniref:LytS/YhcK type 5TM receptor domain-containing protein n=1 Tax=Deinococcus peraridilitoris TaxID=432329 RepID=UPI00030220DD|nr:LytS/YhcK type 5TM receptor domain-containing protein [Deinococcus peraridilitoris]
MFDGLLINFALLIASMCVVSLTYNRVEDIESPSLRVWRWYLCVGTSLLLGHTVPIGHGVLFDFRAVPIALISRRGGTFWGLLAAACVIAYRLYLGGEGVLVAVLNVLLCCWWLWWPA